jgi:vacuolar-type H+-ATPase subunit I/STV1
MSELMVLENINPIEVFSNNGLDSIIDKIEAEVKSVVTDPTTPKGRDEIKSLAYKVARSKTVIDDMGKALTEDWKKKSAAVDAERKRARERLDEIKEEVRKPLTEYENIEKQRVESLKTRLNDIDALIQSGWANQEELSERLNSAKSISVDGWQEFTDQAMLKKKQAVSFFEAELEKLVKYNEQQVELEKLREEQRKQQEEKIAAEAAAKARLEAEAVAKIEQERIETEKKQAELRAADEKARADKAEADRIASEKAASEAAELALIKAEKDAKDAAELALKKERDRLIREQEAMAEAAAKREADLEHKASINREARTALIKVVSDVINSTSDKELEISHAIVVAIAKGEIPHVKINY